MPSIKFILKNLDRKIVNAGITAPGQFKFENEELVKAGIPFHIYYTKDKQEIYATGIDTDITNRFITRLIGNTLFGKYIKSKSNNIANTILLKSQSLKIKKKDYDRGFTNRYFARQGNDINAKIIEISKSDFKRKTSYYIKKVISWQLVGNENTVANNNLREVEFLRKFFKNPMFGLPLLKYWRLNTLDKRAEILSKLIF